MTTQARAISKAAGFMGGGASDRSRMRDNRQAAEAARTEKAIRAQARAILADGEFAAQDGIMHIRYNGHKATVKGRLTPDGWDVRCTRLSASCTLPGEAFAQAVRLRLERNAEEREEAATTPISTAPVKPCDPKHDGGQPLTERAGVDAVLSANAYAFEFTATTGEDVYGCYNAATLEQKYALETVAGIVTHCNCPDRLYRRRTCKHMVDLAVALQTGLRTPGGSVVMAASALSMLQSGPRTVADSLRALREDYHAAAVRAVILTAAQVEAIQ